MNAEKQIRAAIAYSGFTMQSVARKMGWTPQNLYKRLKTGKLTMEEYEQLAKAIGAKLIHEFCFSDGMHI